MCNKSENEKLESGCWDVKCDERPLLRIVTEGLRKAFTKKGVLEENYGTLWEGCGDKSSHNLGRLSEVREKKSTRSEEK